MTLLILLTGETAPLVAKIPQKLRSPRAKGTQILNSYYCYYYYTAAAAAAAAVIPSVINPL